MSCTIKYNAPKNDSQLATRNFLVAKTIIDKFNKILDFTKWSNEAGRLNKIAKDTYNLPENILSSEQQGKVASFNKSMFDEIDRQKSNSILSTNKVTGFIPDNSLFGLDIQNEENLEFHVNTLNVVSQFLENVGIEQRLVSEFLSEKGSVVEGAIAAANFIKGTVDIIDDVEKRPSAWNKLPEEAAHWWYRLLNENSELKKSLWDSHLTALKNDELYKGQYGKLVKSPSDLTEESIGQLIAEAIKRIETKNANAADYSFFKKFLEWINSIIDVFKNTTQDPFEVAAMKILSSDMSDLMTWEEYRKLNNIINFADVLTEQSVAPIDYTLINDIGFIGSTFMEDAEGNATSGYRFHFRDSDWIKKYGDSSPSFYTQEELDNWVSANIKEHDIRQKQQIQEVRDNQIFFDRLLNKTFRKKSKFLPKTLRKYFDIIDAQNLNPLREWDISQELQQITKKLSEQEKKQIIETNGYTNIAPTLKVLPDLLQKYGRRTTPEIIKQEIEITHKLVKKEITKEQAIELRQKLENKKKGNSIVLSETIKIDGAKKQELSILNGIREMIKLENSNLKSITAEEFVNEAHNWLQTNYLLGFANENSYLSYRTDQTFSYLSDRQSNEDVDITNMTEEELQRLPFEERQRIANIVGLTKQNPDVYHNKVSLRFNDKYHLKRGHFDKSPSAWGNLTYFYTGKNKWKDAVLLHEIQNDNIEFLRETKDDNIDLDTSLNQYLEKLNQNLLDNISQIETGGKQVYTDFTGYNSDSSLGVLLNNLIDLPLEQGLDQFQEKLGEKIDLYKAEGIRNNPEKAQEEVEKYYSQRRKFQDFQRKGGIKSFLSAEDLSFLKNTINKLNTEEVFIEGDYFPEENQNEPGFWGIPSLETKKSYFSNSVIPIINKLQLKLKEIYGDDFPIITLYPTTKPRTRTQIRQGRAVRNSELSENLSYMFSFSEQKVIKIISKNIEYAKKNFVVARNKTNAYNFNQNLVKITPKQYSKLIENYKYNKNLLEELVNEKIKKELEKVDISDNKVEKIQKEKENFEKIKQRALAKKIELEQNKEKIRNEITQTLEIEMNYFTPLVHHLIQKHINQYGKDFPMYFSGYNITKLTQGNLRTAMIYAGKDEIDIIDKNKFKLGKTEYFISSNSGEFIKNEKNLTGDKIISQQEYEKAHQQATERKAKEIKYEAAQQIRLLGAEDTLINPKDLEDSKLQEGIRELNEYKKGSKENLDRVINTIMNISNNKPIETGAIYNAMSQVSGVKLIWQDNIEGFKGNPGGYLVDLSNYNYNIPILYGLNKTKIQQPINQVEQNPEETVNLAEQKNHCKL